jgi:hypothetical protein
MCANVQRETQVLAFGGFSVAGPSLNVQTQHLAALRGFNRQNLSLSPANSGTGHADPSCTRVGCAHGLTRNACLHD